MGKIFKEYYQCVGCGAEFDDPDKVRVFTSEVTNGNETKRFIRPNEMYCLDCITLVIDLENKNPETVQSIENPTITEKKTSISDDYIKMVDQRLQEMQKQIEETSISNSETIQNIVETVLDEIAPQLQTVNKYDELHQELENLKGIVIENDTSEQKPEMVYQEEIIHKQMEPETITENKNSSDTISVDEMLTQLVNLDSSQLKDNGKYLVLCRISNNEVEEYYSVINGYESSETLRATIGNKPLIGMYFSVDKYVDSFASTFVPQTVNLIKKMVFGVPIIVQQSIFVSPGCSHAFIKKEDFALQIEAAPKYEVPVEKEVEINSINFNTIEQDKINKPPIDIITDKIPKKENKSKKLISSFKIKGDDYI